MHLLGYEYMPPVNVCNIMTLQARRLVAELETMTWDNLEF